MFFNFLKELKYNYSLQENAFEETLYWPVKMLWNATSTFVESRADVSINERLFFSKKKKKNNSLHMKNKIKGQHS